MIIINLKIITQNKELNLNEKKGTSLKDIIKNNNLDFVFPCGAMGRCGNCKVKVLKNIEKPTKLEEIKLKKFEIDNGIRLACCLNLIDNMEIEIKEIEYNFLD